MFYTDRTRSLLDNPILATDSYKLSHWTQYPPGTDGMFSYIESRGGKFDRAVMFGLQIILMDFFARPITREDVALAKEIASMHGEPFNEAGFLSIVDRYDGYWPLRIRALPEGSLVPAGVPMVTVESTDPELAWVVSFVETMLLQLWYPVTVATTSWAVRQIIGNYLEETSDDPAGQLPFKLHDFGYRGVSSPQTAARGGLAHLVSFKGTDTLAALLAGRAYYGEAMAGYSIPAAEHSTITSWGVENEVEAYRNMIRQYGKPGALFACVSDSTNIYDAVEHLWGDVLRQEVIDSGALLVVRPDSGDPVEVVLRCAHILEQRFGTDTNSKGFKVLRNVRLIQGDGINERVIRDILATLKLNGYSADNIAFGMGGALLQQVNRDTLKFAMKCSAIRVQGQWRDVSKNPVTDPGKASKPGRMTVLRDLTSGVLKTARLEDGIWHDSESFEDAMITVWENGGLKQTCTLNEVRARLGTV
ncbi:nicotinate phosphoribosyltransferase [Methyloversatilis universalis]|uniref:nicotinate phosphoribosyltransferase n=1 Tax=Methyloversatilis universalis TaxID=378211 RepID=UPI00037A0D22|nr:nicotinate phosphoribosyltransferase [Methyloversatilis universalis]